MKKRNFVEWTMHYRQIVILVVTCLVAFGIYSLPYMRKNEFPDFTVRQGIVVAVAPGSTSQEMAEQVAKPLEQYIFSYKEVKKEKTFSQSRDGIVYIQVQLNDEVTDKDAFWSKFKHGVSTFKAQLPTCSSRWKVRTRLIGNWMIIWICSKTACARYPAWDA